MTAPGSDYEVIRSADDRYQVLSSLVTSRTKRHRRRQCIVQGVRPVNRALETGWPLEALLWREGGRLSDWARRVIETAEAPSRYQLTPTLMAGLGGKDEPAELLLVARIPDRRLEDIDLDATSVVCVLDRIQSPGNLGSIVRSADAFGAAAVIVLGHSADPYDPAAVRASTGSIFAVPVVAVEDAGVLTSWSADHGLRIVGGDESAPSVGDGDLAPPVVILLGSEGRGLSRAAADACQRSVSIPMWGQATSLNVASAASILLYEAKRGVRG